MPEKFRNIDRTQSIMIDADFKSFLTKDSLARYTMDIVEQLNLTTIEGAYSFIGNKAYPPRMMLSLLFYSYSQGIFSSRSIERATHELIPVMYITHGQGPDHTVIARFRKDFGKEIASLFVQILEIAAAMGVFELGDISLDGTKIEANASKHKALSYEYTIKLTKQIDDEIEKLMKASKDADCHDFDDLDIPNEIKNRQDRLREIKAAKIEIEARRKIKYDQEKEEYDAKIKAREEKEKILGRKLGGKKPQEPTPEPKSSDQVNLTDSESRIMPVSGGGFKQAYNAQAAIDMDNRLIVENHVTQNTNDKKELEPVFDNIEQLPASLGKVNRAAADNGYDSESNRKLAVKKSIDLHVPKGRQKHNNFLNKHVDTKDSSDDEKKRQKFYDRRKTTIEPLFGVIKSVMGFRKFSLRGIEAVNSEWSLVCIAYNIKRLCILNLGKV